MSKRSVYEIKTANPESANKLANAVVKALDESAGMVPDQDIVFGLCIALAYKARQAGISLADLRRMLDVCLAAPIEEVPAPRGTA